MKWRIRDLVDKAFEVSYETYAGGIHRLVQTIFADEDRQVSRGQSVLIKIKQVEIPRNHLSFIDTYARHPLGNIISLVDDVPKKIDKPRKVSVAAFQAWNEGVIEKGDVVGVVDFVLTEIKERVA